MDSFIRTSETNPMLAARHNTIRSSHYTRRFDIASGFIVESIKEDWSMSTFVVKSEHSRCRYLRRKRMARSSQQNGPSENCIRYKCGTSVVQVWYKCPTSSDIAAICELCAVLNYGSVDCGLSQKALLCPSLIFIICPIVSFIAFT